MGRRMLTWRGSFALALAWQIEAVLCRRVWRVAFFSRLEERKGIKVFVDALHKLDFAALSHSQVQLAAHCGWSEHLLASFCTLRGTEYCVKA